MHAPESWKGRLRLRRFRKGSQGVFRCGDEGWNDPQV